MKMKFDYSLYRPKKVIKEVHTTISSYYKSKDVRASPLTKIGDLADMPDTRKRQIPDRISRRKPVFSRAFDRDRLAFRTSSKRIPAIVPQKFANYKITAPAKSSLRQSFLKQRFLLVKYTSSGAFILLIGIVGGSMHLLGSAMLHSDIDKPADSIEAANSTQSDTIKQKNKAKAAAKKNAAKPTPAASAETPTTTPSTTSTTDDTADTTSRSETDSSDTTGPIQLEITPQPTPNPAPVAVPPKPEPPVPPVVDPTPVPVPEIPIPIQPSPGPVEGQTPPTSDPSILNIQDRSGLR